MVVVPIAVFQVPFKITKTISSASNCWDPERRLQPFLKEAGAAVPDLSFQGCSRGITQLRWLAQLLTSACSAQERSRHQVAGQSQEVLRGEE